MRRITVYEAPAGWSFLAGDIARASGTALAACVAAAAFGDSLEGIALGYIVRLDTGAGLLAMHTHVFGSAGFASRVVVPALG